MKTKKLPRAPHVVGDIEIFFNENEIEVFNPANGKVLGLTSDFNGVVSALEDQARKAQKCWFYEVEEQEKEAVFRAIIQKIEKNRGMLARTMVLESGKLWK